MAHDMPAPQQCVTETVHYYTLARAITDGRIVRRDHLNIVSQIG
jgi:hypothetical protein